jgi:two-component system chemotaxis sensor kinase CheA
MDKKYLGIYLDEMRDHLEDLSRNILALEKNPRREILNQLFRTFHTIKGMSATMGFKDVSDLSHSLEELLEEVRSHGHIVDGGLIDLLLESVDILENKTARLERGDYADIAIEGVLSKLNNALNGRGPPDQAREEVVRVDVSLDKDCALKSVRAFMVFKELEKIGQVVRCDPSEEKIEAGDFGDDFTVYVLTSKKNEIREKLATISEVERVNIAGGIKEEEPSEGVKREITSVQSIRVPIQRLDYLMNLVGELVISRSRLASIAEKYDLEDLREAVAGVERLVSDLQEEIMEMRMVEVAYIFDRFPRMVRDLAKKEGKKVDFIIEGRDIKLDRTVLDEIGVPLVHLLRNAVDHGIESPEERRGKGKRETGTVKLIASREKKHVEITVTDDGRGIDIHKIREIALKKGLKTREELDKLSEKELLMLIFTPGISSAEKITDVSGRGVGMDVVKNKIVALGGTVELESEKDKGTTITLRLPLTLAIIQALLVGLNGETYILPLNSVRETIKVRKDEFKTVLGREVIQLRGNVIPIYRLSRLFNSHQREQDEYHAIIVEHNNQAYGVVVDRLLGQDEIVIKSLDVSVRDSRGVGGATILGDGRVALIIDIPSLIGGE